MTPSPTFGRAKPPCSSRLQIITIPLPVPEEDLDPVATPGSEYHHHASLGRKPQLGLRHRCQPIVALAEVYRFVVITIRTD